jgi:uroporphyrin-III C-methyltransferase
MRQTLFLPQTDVITMHERFRDDDFPPVTDDQRGKVYLIGAGPGDPELITVKGLRYLRAADVILYDRLVSTELLREAHSGAELIFVGKESGCHSLAQDQINALLIYHALQDRVVVRLKGGDPFVFGRGGEEAQALAAAEIPFEVVPGISSAIAVPAYAGIPVTHREYTSSVTIVTGHEGRSASPPVNWEALAALGGTLVILMGVKALPHFTKKLIAHGMDADVPAATIQEGTTSRQRVVVGTLGTIAERALKEGLSTPALTIIGSVVTTREALAWYEERNEERAKV